MTALCSCQSGLNYTDCCEPFHQNHAIPQTAEQLMRSRYCAYVMKNIDYIVATTAPNQQVLLDKKGLLDWAKTTKWTGLEIVSHIPTLSKTHSTVEFNAFFATENGEQVHHETSLFVKINARWYFVDPTVDLPTQKQPCLCGSGKKFKHCCGTFL